MHNRGDLAEITFQTKAFQTQREERLLQEERQAQQDKWKQK